ncbi:hypothetical protein ACIRU3_05620 [Streptomyces sp. NPDC101151]|uniref:hypothetical protein n=1 Tax=Streptomyces sp. NPDC101151 TaxID=3366115 RepID=UPI00381D8B75
MSLRTLAGLSIACAVLLAPLTGCTSDHSEAKKPSRSARSSEPGSAEGTATPGGTAQPSVQVPPELDADETLAGRQKATTGNAGIAYGKGKKGDALIVAVRCRGTGKIKVAVRSAHVSFPLECLDDQVSTTYNQVAVGGVDRSGVVSVEAPSSVRWSLTIGRGAPAQEETPTATAESL